MPRGLQRLPACARPATRRQPVRQRAAQCLSEATWQSVGGRATRPPRPVDQGHAPHPTAQRPALRLGAPDGRMPDATSASGRWGNGQALQPRARGAGLRRLPGAGERARLGAQRAAGTLFSLARRRQVPGGLCGLELRRRARSPGAGRAPRERLGAVALAAGCPRACPGRATPRKLSQHAPLPWMQSSASPSGARRPPSANRRGGLSNPCRYEKPKYADSAGKVC